MSKGRRLYTVLFFFLFFVLLASSIASYAQAPLQFVSIAPCRVVDTRGAPGPFGGPTMDANTERDFAIPQGPCSNIPSIAAAYSVNVTVVPWQGLNYLTIWPTGQTMPVVSTLNSYDGRVKANAAIVPAGSPNESVSVYVTNKTDVIIDIDGYFAAPGTPDVTTLPFFPLTPCRVVDTRGPTGPLGGPYLEGGSTPRIFPVLSSNCNIPDSAQAYSLNMTAIPHKTLNYLTVWPTGESQPTVSTINAPTGTVVANAAIVPVGTQGSIDVYVTDDIDLLIDVDGFFAPASSNPNPLSLYNLAPCRVLDTRPPHGNGAFSGAIPVSVLTSNCNVPGAQGYVFNATVVPNGGPMGYLSLWPDAEGQPVVSTLNAYDGAVTSNMAIVPTLNGDIDAYAFNSTNLIMDIFGYFAPITALNVTTSSLPSGAVGYSYSATLLAAGGVPPYTWSVTSGNLPPGLQLNAGTGAISGVPTMPVDNDQITVQAADSETPAATAQASLSITVSSSISLLQITTTTLPSGSQNTPYTVALAATGGLTPYMWSIASGSLPPGLNLNAGTGAITGTPSGAGVSNFEVQVTDAESPAQASVEPLSIMISPAVPLSISTTTLPSGTAGTPYSEPITAIGGVYPYTWSVTGGKIPDGLTLNTSTGVVSGTPQNVGTSQFTVQVTDSETPPVQSAPAQISLTINSPGGGGNPGLLSGNYAFYLNGFNSSGAWTLAGSFISNGNGSITSGVIDYNSVPGPPVPGVAITGTYAISSVNVNTMTIRGSGWGPMTLAFTLDSTGNGRVIEYDDATGQGSRGSGPLRKATASAFSLSALNGGWAFGLTGADNAGRFVNAGAVSLNSSGSMTNGQCDTNEAGSYSTCTFSGTISAVNSQTGRATAAIQSSNGATHEVIYVVSASEMLMAQSDSDINGPPIQVGEVLKQSGTFSNGSLNGLAVMYTQEIHGGDGLDRSQAGIVSFDGRGNYDVSVFDEDQAGTIVQDPPFQGTYTVQSNGAVNLQQTGKSPIAGFLISQNKAFFVNEGSSTTFGMLEPQTGGPFSNASMSGSYAAGSLPPLDYANASTDIFLGTADGQGNLNVNGASSNAGGIDQYFGVPVTYSIASNGRGTAIAQGDSGPSIVYMISPSRAVIMHPEQGADMDVMQH